MMNDEGGMMNDGMMSTIHQWALNDNNWSFDHARAGWRFALPSTSRRLCVKESSSHSAANVRLVGGGQTGLEVPGEVIWSSSIIFCIIYTIWYYVIWNHIILYYSILYDILLLYNFIHQKKVWPLSLRFWGPRGARTTATAERSCPAAPYAKGVTSWGEAFAGAAGGNLVNLSQVWGCDLWVFSSDWPGTISTCVVHLRRLWLVARRGGEPKMSDIDSSFRHRRTIFVFTLCRSWF